MDYLEQIQLVVRAGLELGISRFQVRRPSINGAPTAVDNTSTIRDSLLFPFTHPEFGRVIFRQRGYCICDLFSESHEVPKNNGLIFHMGEVSEL